MHISDRGALFVCLVSDPKVALQGDQSMTSLRLASHLRRIWRAVPPRAGACTASPARPRGRAGERQRRRRRSKSCCRCRRHRRRSAATRKAPAGRLSPGSPASAAAPLGSLHKRKIKQRVTIMSSITCQQTSCSLHVQGSTVTTHGALQQLCLIVPLMPIRTVVNEFKATARIAALSRRLPAGTACQSFRAIA